jgi:hypothetical protein
MLGSRKSKFGRVLTPEIVPERGSNSCGVAGHAFEPICVFNGQVGMDTPQNWWELIATLEYLMLGSRSSKFGRVLASICGFWRGTTSD